MPLLVRKFVVLTLDKNTWLCQFGCPNVHESSRMAIYRHLYEAHTAEELKPWGINRDLLREDTVKDEVLRERNMYGIDPVSGYMKEASEIPIRPENLRRKKKSKKITLSSSESEVEDKDPARVVNDYD